MAVARDDLKPAIMQQERMVIAEVYYTDDEKIALIRELDRIIEDDSYPLSPRIQTLKAILNKIRPEPVREPLPRTEALRAAASRAIPPQTVNEIRNVQIEDAVH